VKLKLKTKRIFPCGLQIEEETNYESFRRVGGEINMGDANALNGCPIHGKSCPPKEEKKDGEPK
jgi:hypothetical protein